MRFKGERTEKVTLKKRSVTYNSLNEPVEDWDSNDTTIYAEFLERHGKEGGKDGQVLVIQDVRCKIRYRTALDTRENPDCEATHRIVRDGITYDITSAIPEGRRQKIMLMLQRRS